MHYTHANMFIIFNVLTYMYQYVLISVYRYTLCIDIISLNNLLYLINKKKT